MAKDLAPIAGRTDALLYSFAYFCPPAGTSPMPYWAAAPFGHCTDNDEYKLMSVETADSKMIPDMVGFKKQSPNLKVLLSVGGWNFPSAFYSKMAKTAESRKKFIDSCKHWMEEKGFDGIDIDWEFPCSGPRVNPV